MTAYAKLALVLALLAAGFAGGYKVADWRADAAKLVVAERAAKDLQDMTAARDQLAKVLQTSNDAYQSKLRKSQNETNHLRDDVSIGSAGLRIAATCGEPRLGAQTTASAGVAVGDTAELGTTARRAYFNLKDGIDRASAMIEGLQDQLKQRVPQ